VIEGVVKGLFFDVILKAAASRIISAIPFLGWPGINTIFIGLLTKLAQVFYEELHRAAVFSLIDWRIEGERRVYEKALSDLRQAMDTEKGVEDAKQKFRNALADLIRMRKPAS
jgi:hypothetical protein